MSLSKRLRFEVFKRDSFTCQYCGKKSPDVVLHADHINPRAAGGTDDMLNLITSCIDCNLGKSDKLLSDSTVVEKQRDQLALLQERKEQIEMMMEWQAALYDLGGQVVDGIAERWCVLANWSGLTETARAKIKKWVKKYSAEEVMVAMYTAHTQYVEYDDDGFATNASANVAFDKIGAICRVTRDQKEKPYLKDLFYIRKIVENRCSYFDKRRATEILNTAYEWNADTTELVRIAKAARNWSEWQRWTCEYVSELNGGLGA